MKTTTSGRAFAKNIFELFSTLMISLPIENHKIFLKSYPNSFTAEDAISNLGGLQFIQANHDTDPKDPTRIITRVVTTRFSLSRDMAKNLCQTFMDARLFESASDPSKRDFQNKGVYQVTGKGAHIVQRFVRRNSLSVEETRHITANATPQILFLERAEDEDAVVLNRKAIDAIFKHFAGSRPNVMARASDSAGDSSPLTSSPGRDRIQANVDRSNGIKVKDQQHNYDMYKHTFYGKAAIEWLLDNTTVISKEEAICIAQEMVSARYIGQVGEDNRNGPTLFKTGNSALYHFTELGRAVLGWENPVRSRGSSVSTDWMDERTPLGSKADRTNSELLLLNQFKLTSNTVSRLPISVGREKRRSADESTLSGSTQRKEDATSNSSSVHRLSQILDDPAFQILSESGALSSYAPSSSGKESVGQREPGTSSGGPISTIGFSAQPTTSNTTRLNLILSNSTLREMFKSFLKQNICEENLAFYLEVLDYRAKFNTLINSTRAYNQTVSGKDPLRAASGMGLSPGGGLAMNAPQPATLRELEKQICTQAFAIHETYLVSGAPRELNLPHQMRQDITAYMQAVVRNMEAPLPSSSPSSSSTNECDSGFGTLPDSPESPLSPSTVQEGENGRKRYGAGHQELIHISLFDRIHDHIFRLMSTDSVPKFTKTDKYREVMVNRVRQRDSTSGSSNIKGSSNSANRPITSPSRSKFPTLGGARIERVERSASPAL